MSVIGIFYAGIGGFTDISAILQSWADAGIFAYVLPFLVIFAVIFGILSKTKIFGEGKAAVEAIIAGAVGLLALQFDFVPSFFSQIFPRLGVGLSVLLVIIILMTLFIDWNDESSKGWKIALAIVGAVIALVVILTAFSSNIWWDSWWWQDYSGAIVLGIIIIAIIGIVIWSGSRNSGTAGKPHG